MVRSNVRVILRTRPTDRFANERIAVQEDQKTVVVTVPRRQGTGAGGASPMSAGAGAVGESQAFHLDYVLKDASQEAVFEACGAEAVRGAMGGYNGCVMAYGQTGAGKTFTMMGGSDYRTRGIIPRALRLVFDEVQLQADRQFTVQVSYIEIYNDRITDLLDPESKEDFAILEDARGNITVRGAQCRTCVQEAEALACLFLGNQNRSTSEHTLNGASSRSHAIFTIFVTSRSRVESESAALVGKLHLVDLAGSERLSKTATSDGKGVREAQHINKSLTFLEQVVLALGTTSRNHVPFRQSKLTNILKDALGGNSRTTMVANVWPEERHLDESVGTLRFATRMMKLQADATVNVSLDPQTHIKQLQRQITELKAELQMQNQLMGKSHIAYEGDLGDDEKFEMQKTVKAYLDGGAAAPEIPVRSLREVKEYFRIFKLLAAQREVELREAARMLQAAGVNGDATRHEITSAGSPGHTSAPATAARAGAGAKKGAQAQQVQEPPAPPPGVGTLEPSSGTGIGVGVPARNLRELTRVGNKITAGTATTSTGAAAATVPLTPQGADASGVSTFGGRASPSVVEVSALANRAAAAASGPPPSRNDAFVTFRAHEGSHHVETLRQRSEGLKDAQRRLHELAGEVNTLKAQIDGAQAQLDRKQQQRLARRSDDVYDDEELEMARRVKTLKAQYRGAHEDLTAIKTTRDNASRLVDAAKRQLLEGFEGWYTNAFAGASAHPRSPGAPLSPAVPKSSSAGASRRATVVANGAMHQPASASVSRGLHLPPLGASGGAADAAWAADELDEGERFELLQLHRVMGEDPDAVAYYQAKKLTAGLVSKSPPRRRV
jgi:kinesin family protein 6/9